MSSTPQLQESASASALESSTNVLAVRDSNSPIFQSDCYKLKMSQHADAHRKQILWLETALNQQITEYEKAWASEINHHASMERSRNVMLQRRAEAEKATNEHIQARLFREDRACKNRASLQLKRDLAADKRHQREISRDKRLDQEGAQRTLELARRVQAEAQRRDDLRVAVLRSSEERSLAAEERARLKSNKAIGLANMSQRQQQLRKTVREKVDDSIASMRLMIEKQQVRSMYDGEALRRHMRELVASVERAVPESARAGR